MARHAHSRRQMRVEVVCAAKQKQQAPKKVEYGANCECHQNIYYMHWACYELLHVLDSSRLMKTSSKLATGLASTGRLPCLAC